MSNAESTTENFDESASASSATHAAAPYLTADLPGIGGTIKQVPEDFVVEEIPAYHPCGEGEHLFLWIEKRNVSAEQLTRHVSRVLGVSDRDIGVAGLKDRFAVSRQFVSVPARLSDRVEGLDTNDIRVLTAARHANKLRTGHLRGNRFTILVRDVAEQSLDKVQRIAERIKQHGFPNYYGEQRFGHDGETVRTGLDLLTGKISKNDLPRTKARFLLRLAISAVQSQLFNTALAERLREGLFDRVLVGDVMQVVASGGVFVVEDVAIEQPRFDSGETVVTGPMFGPKMKASQGEPGERERKLLESNGLQIEQFANYAKLAQGTRRPYLVRPTELELDSDPNGLLFRFTLPSGVYATTLLREFQK